MSQSLQEGDIVRIVTFNPAFHGLLAEVAEVHDSWAKVEVPLFIYGQIPGKAEYRASFEELMFVANAHEIPDPEEPIPLLTAGGSVPKRRGTAASIEFSERIHKNGKLIEDIADKRMDSVAQGYTGDPCQKCNSFTLRRNGACLICDTCGESNGCS